jgi:hypothetical protein
VGKKEYDENGKHVQVAKFLLSALGDPNQYFNSPPLAHASSWDF